MVGSTGRLVTVRDDPLSALAAAPPQSVHIGTIFLGDPDTSSHATFKMSGAAKGLTTLAVDVAVDGSSLASEPSLSINPNNGLWVWETTLIVPPSSTTLTAQAGATSGAMSDTAFVDLPEPRMDIPFGVLANTSADDVAYLAGFPDRFVGTRSFGVLDRFLFERNLFVLFIRSAAQSKQPFVWIADVRQKLMLRIDVQRAIGHINKERDSVQARMAAEDREKLRFHAQQSLIDKLADDGSVVPLDRAQISPEQRPWMIEALDIAALPNAATDAKAYVLAVVAKLLKLENTGLQLGLLFHDRVRFREVGVTRSQDVIFSLSLDANEEAQITVTTSTLRRRNIEDVTSQEVERELELSSQWSNDLAFGVDLDTTSTQGVNFGGNVGGQIPKIPLSAGIQAGYSASQTSSEATTFAVQTARERTARAAIRMRNEHKISIERGNEFSTQQGTVKTISNRGSQRPRRIEYRKLFKKLMVTYERHDAMLCLRLSVPDPSAAVRQRFRATLPVTLGEETPTEAPPATPDNETKVKVVRHTWKIPQDELPTFAPAPITHTDYINLNIKTGANTNGSASPGTVDTTWELVEPPVLRVTSARRRSRVWRPGGNGVVGVWVDHNHELTADTAVELREGVIAPAGVFGGIGNKISWVAPPSWRAGSINGEARIRLDYLHVEFFLNAGQLAELSFEVESKWQAPADPIAIDTSNPETATAETEEEPRPTYEDLTVMRDVAIADFVPSVMDQAMRLHLSPLSDTVAPSLLPEYFAFEEAQVDTGPYWASDTTRQEYSALESALSALPLNFPISDILAPELVASEAVVYLPVRAGRERDVLTLLTIFDDAEAEAIANDIETFRAEKFGPTEAAGKLPTMKELTEPQGIEGTQRTETSWKKPWEEPQQAFEILAHWHELVPMDGADCETVLSQTSATDEAYIESKNNL